MKATSVEDVTKLDTTFATRIGLESSPNLDFWEHVLNRTTDIKAKMLISWYIKESQYNFSRVLETANCSSLGFH